MRSTLITGVSRRQGIGFAAARRLLASGGRVFAHSFVRYDAGEPWGADPVGISGIVEALGGVGNQLAHADLDLAAAEAPGQLVREASQALGPLDS